MKKYTYQIDTDDLLILECGYKDGIKTILEAYHGYMKDDVEALQCITKLVDKLGRVSKLYPRWNGKSKKK